MKIIKLQSENVKKLSAVEITPDGNVIVIGGKNGAGKSSVLDSIMYALGGKGVACEKPVRTGQKKAKITLTMDDIIVTRTFTDEGGGTITVSNLEGTSKFSSPQSMLDAIVGRLSFDPLAFSLAKPVEQVKMLRELTGVDFTALDAKRKAVYDERTIIGRDIKTYTALMDSTPRFDGVPEEETSSAECMAKLNAVHETNASNERKRVAIVFTESQIAENDEKIKDTKDRIFDLQQRLDFFLAQKKQMEEGLAVAKAEVETLEDLSLAEVEAEIGQIDQVNAKVRQNKKRDELSAKVKKLTEQQDRSTARIEAIDDEKQEQLQQAKFPIVGLGFSESGVTYNSMPFSQCSSGEQLRVSLAMGMAMNPKLKVLLVRDASLLDADNWKTINDMAAENGYQLWMEKVSDDGEGCTILIEDGHVR